MKTAGLNQTQLAQRLAGKGADHRAVESERRQVVRWANGQSLPDDTSAARLARALRVPADTFATPAEVRPLGVARALADLEERIGQLEAEREADGALIAELREQLLALERSRVA